MKKLCRGLTTVNHALQKAEMVLGCLCLATLFIVMIVNAALRYLFKSGLNWSDELNGFLFVWFGFLAAAYAMSNQTHLNITAIVLWLPRAVQLFLRAVMDLIMIVMFVLYLPPLNNLMSTLPISNVMRIPLEFIYVILPISFLLMCYHILCNLIQDIVDFLAPDSQGKERRV